MFKKRLALILSFFLLIVSSALVAGSLVPRQSARAVKFSGNATTTTPIPTGTPTTGTAAADSFQRTVTSGWGSADTGGWWTVVGSPWPWAVPPGAGSVTVGANSEERAYLSSFTSQEVGGAAKVVLPHCRRSTTHVDAFVI